MSSTEISPRSIKGPKNTGTVTGVKNIEGGSYNHFGIAAGILSQLSTDENLQDLDSLSLNINIDGHSLIKSIGDQFWTILGLVKESPGQPFMIGVWKEAK